MKGMYVGWSDMGSHPLVIVVGVVLDISVLSIETTWGHRANIVRMGKTLDDLVSEMGSVVRIETPFKHLVT